jgi:hypothetical protein
MPEILIGTLSMERNGSQNTPMAKDRLDVLCGIVRDHAPDLLVCALDYLASSGDVDVLAERLGALDHSTTVVVDSAPRHNQQNKTAFPVRFPSVMLIEPGQQPRELARQLIAGSAQKSERLAEALREQMSSRMFSVKERKVVCLCCGEINFFTCDRGTENVHFFRQDFGDVEDGFQAADIILNPTHDVMTSRTWITIPKREFLSHGNGQRKRCYVSVSNWDRTKGQQRDRDDLHTVYVDEQLVPRDRINLGRADFAYSQTTVSL